MKKTIKIIDLIIIQANEKELPKKLKVDNDVFEYSDTTSDYILINADYTYYLFRDYVFDTNNNRLNKEVEIISDEEEFEDIEKINYYPVRKNEIAVDYIENNETKHFCLNKKEKYFSDKINQLIKNQKKIIERINNENK